MVDVGDILRFDIAGEMDLLKPAIQMLFDQKETRRIKGWSLDAPNNRLYMHWVSRNNANTIVPDLVGKGSISTYMSVAGWLEEADYGTEPRTDGSVAKGFHMFNERWEQVNGDHTIWFAIEPHWVVYGK